ncbi:MAG: SAM-dependent methyltransferase, partial [Helicobacter sp.]|nr:SAM-dependent methyltransferase [Helicobacter sp.]
EHFKPLYEFDFVFAVWFLPAFTQQKRREILKALLGTLSLKTIFVATCICEFSYFFEHLRILLGLYLVRDVEGFSNKISLLCDCFASHLEALEFASRPIKDWVSDTILNPVCDQMSFSLETCIVEIESLGKNIEVLGMSPNMFANLSWYKDTQYSYAKVIKESFKTKRHLLLCYSFKDSYRDEGLNKDLLQDIICLKTLVKEFRDSSDNAILPKAASLLRDIIQKHKDLGEFFTNALLECIYLLENPKFIESQKIASLPNFSKAWGRGQQYISFRVI